MSVFALALLAVPALATIAPTSPTASTSCKGGSTCKIAWIDDGSSPSLSSFGATNVYLAVGNQYQQTIIQDFGAIDPSSQSSINPTIYAEGGADSDSYFIRFQSASATDSDGNPLESFSAKFTLSDMTGSFSPAVSAQMAGVTSAGESQVLITATGGAAASASAPATVTVTKSGSAAASSSTDADSAAAPSFRAAGVAALAGALLALLA